MKTCIENVIESVISFTSIISYNKLSFKCGLFEMSYIF